MTFYKMKASTQVVLIRLRGISLTVLLMIIISCLMLAMIHLLINFPTIIKMFHCE